MKIVGGKDYYDSARSFGFDPNIVFVRTGKTIEGKPGLDAVFPNINLEYIEKNAWPHINTFYVDTTTTETRYELTPVLCFVAGKRYFGIKVHWIIDTTGANDYKVFWDMQTLESFLAERDVRFATKELWHWSAARNSGPYKSTAQYIFNQFAHKETQSEIDWLIRNKITIALYWLPGICTPLYSHRSEKNDFKWEFDTDSLKHVDFYAKMHPNAIFQEISQWVGGVLPNPGNPMVQITDDKVKIHKAGFDTKTSFRKGKQT